MKDNPNLIGMLPVIVAFVLTLIVIVIDKLSGV
jgi:hypothetical protein